MTGDDTLTVNVDAIAWDCTVAEYTDAAIRYAPTSADHARRLVWHRLAVRYTADDVPDVPTALVVLASADRADMDRGAGDGRLVTVHGRPLSRGDRDELAGTANMEPDETVAGILSDVLAHVAHQRDDGRGWVPHGVGYDTDRGVWVYTATGRALSQDECDAVGLDCRRS